MVDHRSGDVDGDVGARNLINGVAPDLPNRFDLQSKSVHVALSQVSAAGVERHLAAGRDQVFQLEKLIALLRCAEAVLDDGHEITLTAKEFMLLQYFLEHRGRVLSRDQLLRDVWDYQYTGGTRTVDVHVRRLREKLPALVDALVTVKQFGYKLTEGE